MTEAFKNLKSLIFKTLHGIFGNERINPKTKDIRTGDCKLERAPFELGQDAYYDVEKDTVYLSSNLITNLHAPIGKNTLIHEIIHSYNPALDKDLTRDTSEWQLYEGIIETISRLIYKEIFGIDILQGNYDDYLIHYFNKISSFLKKNYNIEIQLSYSTLNLNGNILIFKKVLLDKELIEKVKNHFKNQI